jgi:hypothetical protein
MGLVQGESMAGRFFHKLISAPPGIGSEIPEVRQSGGTLRERHHAASDAERTSDSVPCAESHRVSTT